jgi:hypothetical protein
LGGEVGGDGGELEAAERGDDEGGGLEGPGWNSSSSSVVQTPREISESGLLGVAMMVCSVVCT